MTQERTGGCLCGAVRYVIRSAPRGAVLCHCSHCRKLGGSVFSLNLAIKDADFEQQGETTVYIDSGDSGQPVQRHFCGRCGSALFAKTALAPGRVVVKAGTLDSLDGLQPTAEIYAEHAAPWLAPVAGAKRFARNM